MQWSSERKLSQLKHSTFIVHCGLTGPDQPIYFILDLFYSYQFKLLTKHLLLPN